MLTAIPLAPCLAARPACDPGLWRPTPDAECTCEYLVHSATCLDQWWLQGLHTCAAACSFRLLHSAHFSWNNPALSHLCSTTPSLCGHARHAVGAAHPCICATKASHALQFCQTALRASTGRAKVPRVPVSLRRCAWLLQHCRCNGCTLAMLPHTAPVGTCVMASSYHQPGASGKHHSSGLLLLLYAAFKLAACLAARPKCPDGQFRPHPDAQCTSESLMLMSPQWHLSIAQPRVSAMFVHACVLAGARRVLSICSTSAGAAALLPCSAATLLCGPVPGDACIRVCR